MSTIAAISTASGIGGIGIIRMSGKDCFEILSKFFIPKNKKMEPRGYNIQYGHIINPETKQKIDEVLVSYFIEPKSYTKENLCEIHSHGGNIIMKQILELCLENGASLAEPGEFTKRAFLNGRIDLAQAEAVIDILNAKTELEAQTAEKQLDGQLSHNIEEIRSLGISLMSNIEASIDYPEYDIEEVSKQELTDILLQIEERLEKLIKSFDNGKLVKDGIKTAIVGTPNAGKSSLLNAFLKEDRAIVTEYAGTTRDTIEEYITVNGIALKIIDTAGIRETENEIEKIGIEKSKKLINEADLVIAIFDGSKELTCEDELILKLISSKVAIIVLNKEDIGRPSDEMLRMLQIGKPIVSISALKEIGIDSIYNEIINLFDFSRIKQDSPIMITNIRHKHLIEQARKSAQSALKTIHDKMPIDIISIQIKDMLEYLGKITGNNVSEDIIQDIFSKFCLGK